MHIKEATHLNKPNDCVICYFAGFSSCCGIFEKVIAYHFIVQHSKLPYTRQHQNVHICMYTCVYIHESIIYMYMIMWITGMSINHQYTHIPVNSSFGTFSYEHLLDVHSNLNRKNIWKMPAGTLFALISNQHQPASMHSHQIKTMWNIIIVLIILDLILA